MKKFEYVEAVASWSAGVAAVAFLAFVGITAYCNPEVIVGMLGVVALITIPPYLWVKFRG